MFKHDLLIPFNMNRVDSDEGRLYEVQCINQIPCPGRDCGFFIESVKEKYPSVTSVLAKYYGTEWLDEWKAKVGEETANRISTQAKRRGTAMHELYESFLLNKKLPQAMPVNTIEFNKVRPILEQNISTIRGVELKLFSRKLGLAGTCDALVEWQFKGLLNDSSLPVILDFKTSKRRKTEEQIESYFVQATIYAMMVEELYGFDVPYIMIIMTVDHDTPQLFSETSHKFRSKVFEIIQHANKNKGKTN